MSEHSKDSDCTVGDDGLCIECGVDHSSALADQPIPEKGGCPVCGGRGFHQTNPIECPEIYAASSNEHVTATEAWQSYYARPWWDEYEPTASA